MLNIIKNLLFKLSRSSSEYFRQADYIWLIHPLTLKDVLSRYVFLKFLPKSIVLKFLSLMPPMILAPITGLKSTDGRELHGYLVGCFILPEQIRADTALVRKKVYSVAKIAEKLGANILGLGGIIVVDSAFEKRTKEDLNVALANGTATAAVVMSKRIDKILKGVDKRYDEISLAIVNATSLKGRLLSVYWSNYKFKEILLVGKTPDNLAELKKRVRRHDVKTTTQIRDIKNYDLVIVAPSYARLDFLPDYFRDDMIIYDINDPHYDFTNIVERFPSIRVYTNGLINTEGINYNYDLGVPSYSSHVCLAETFLLARSGTYDRPFFNGVGLDEVAHIKKIFTNSGFFLID